VQLWGTHAFKPPTEQYPHLPENEDVCMHLAEICGFKVAVHGLIRFKTGELAYITKRFDRAGSERLHQEDFCQLTETLTENKYQSSVERIGKAIQRYATNPGVDCINFYEQVIFSFLIGNADMHLKNYSLIRTRDGDYTLSPAYDLVATKLAVPKDLEESALSIHGKKKNITRSDLLNFGETLLIPEKVLHTSLEKLLAKLPELCAFVRNSFLPAQQQEQLIDLMRARGNRLSKTKA
jgi:serine/threonine-protein kinase HipA